MVQPLNAKAVEQQLQLQLAHATFSALITALTYVFLEASIADLFL